MRIFLLATTVFTMLLAGGAIACSTCADRGWTETREQCKACNGDGKKASTKTSECNRCGGGGKQGQYQGTFCRQCRGSGVNSSTSWLTCKKCNGTGTKVTKITCHTCKGAAVLNGLGEENAGVSTTSYVAVETCTLCDKNGNVSHKIACEICDKGWNHDKTKQDTYICRNCGVVCDSIFSPCKCGKPDCPHCKGGFEKTVTAACTLCGGDKTITPLEREKVKKKAVSTCTLCDKNGNVSHKIACEICDKGWNHDKTKQDTYVCRNCAAVCDSRFSPCKCGKPDCPHCKGECEKTVTAPCTLCGRDMTVTSLEREKAKNNMERK